MHQALREIYRKIPKKKPLHRRGFLLPLKEFSRVFNRHAPQGDACRPLFDDADYLSIKEKPLFGVDGNFTILEDEDAILHCITLNSESPAMDNPIDFKRLVTHEYLHFIDYMLERQVSGHSIAPRRTGEVVKALDNFRVDDLGFGNEHKYDYFRKFGINAESAMKELMVSRETLQQFWIDENVCSLLQQRETIGQEVFISHLNRKLFGLSEEINVDFNVVSERFRLELQIYSAVCIPGTIGDD